MSKHLQTDLDRIKKQVLSMGALVEEAIRYAIDAVVNRRPELAAKVLAGDDRIDQREVEVEDACLKILALHRPVAGDLRYVVAVMKVNNDLERMGDLALNIAERATYLAAHPALQAELPFDRMTATVQSMVSDALDALVNQDTRLARAVGERDDEVDDLNRGLYGVLQELMHRDSATIERAVHTLSVGRHLERIADLATNIAEDVVFMVEGEIIRHSADEAPIEPERRPPPRGPGA